MSLFRFIKQLNYKCFVVHMGSSPVTTRTKVAI
nr:MAG TPA: YgaU [Caudoviricetes sp.]